MPELSDDPLGWVGEKLADLDGLLASARFPADTAGPDDAEQLRAVVPEIVAVTGRLLDQVRAGQAGIPPHDVALAGRVPAGGGTPVAIRAGWL